MNLAIGIIGSNTFDNYIVLKSGLNDLENTYNVKTLILENNTGVGRIGKTYGLAKNKETIVDDDVDCIIKKTDIIVGFMNKHEAKDTIKKLESVFKNFIIYTTKGELIKRQIYRPLGYVYKWARTVKRGEPYFECSSKGHKEYSAIFAKVNDKSIEEIYQLDIKGYRGHVKHWKEAKGKPPLTDITEEQSYNQYLMLWCEYFKEHPDLYKRILKEAIGKTITDMFGVTPINQARAICDLCNIGLIT